METDKRPFYVWMIVLTTNIVVDIYLTLIFKGFENLTYLLTMGFFLLLSVISTLVSKSNIKWKNYIGFSIPILLLLLFILIYLSTAGCGDSGGFFTGLCRYGDHDFGLFSFLSAIIFSLFYTIGIYSRKWNSKFVFSLILIIPILIYPIVALIVGISAWILSI